MKNNTILLREKVKLLNIDFFTNDSLQNEEKILLSLDSWAKIYPIKPYYKNYQNIIHDFKLNRSSQVYKIILKTFIKKKNINQFENQNEKFLNKELNFKNEIEILKNQNEKNEFINNDLLMKKLNNLNEDKMKCENKKLEISNFEELERVSNFLNKNYDENNSYEIENYSEFNFLIWNNEKFKILSNFIFKDEKMNTVETLITKIVDGEKL